jgi:subtilisin family serine protease
VAVNSIGLRRAAREGHGRSCIRTCAAVRVAVAAAVMVIAPAASAARPAWIGGTPVVASDDIGARTNAVGSLAPGAPQLLVTFADTPDQATAADRLAGLGAIEESVPEIGIWALAPTSPADARAAVLRREGVARAEWSVAMNAAALTDPRPAPPATLPLQTLPDPTDAVYQDAVQSWQLRSGSWAYGLDAYDRPPIAILDSGIDSTHPEWNTPGVLAFPHSFITGQDRAEDVVGHGSHVAGIAAAPANGVGVVGVAPASATATTPGMNTVIPVQIADSRGVSTSKTHIAGIRWAVTHGAKVINISSGGRGYVQAYQDTINWAFLNGTIIVASAGNNGLQTGARKEILYPVGYDHVIGVAAQCDARIDFDLGCETPFGVAGFSNAHEKVDLLAPGVNIPSSVPAFVSQDLVAPGYGLESGTSMAAPFVAGTAALVYASHPGITPFQVTRILEDTASRAVGGLRRIDTAGWGLVNPLAAAQAQAPFDDVAEPNDDIKWLLKTNNVRPKFAPIRFDAWADSHDDQVDVYGVLLKKGERMRVTISAARGRMGPLVFRPSARHASPGLMTEAEFDAKLLGASGRATPGTRGIVVKAKESGRHFVTVFAADGGGTYTLKIQRLR